MVRIDDLDSADQWQKAIDMIIRDGYESCRQPHKFSRELGNSGNATPTP
jgi:hypothetical protein